MDRHVFSLAVIAILAVFLFDLFIPADLAIWLLYAIPILLASRKIGTRKILFLTCLCTFMVFAGFYYFFPVPEPEIALLNRLLGVGVFWIIVFLDLELNRALEQVRHSRDNLELKVDERTADLRRTDELFRMAANAAGAMIYWLDVKNRLITAIHGMPELLGYQPAEVPVSYDWWQQQIHPDDYPAYRKEVDDTLAAGESSHSFEYRIRHKDGRYIYIRNTIRFIRDEQGSLTYLVGTILDVTRVKEYMARLEALNRDLESFSYSISHDLRAPLRFIHGFTRMVLEDHGEALGEEGRKKLKMIEDNVDRMDQLVLGILALSRAERTEIQNVDLDMRAIVMKIIDELQATLPKRRPEVIVRDLPDARGDPVLIRQVFVNLLSNAFKFTGGKEHPKIEIGASAKTSENEYYVRDNGAGFDMRNAGRLFGLFQRLHGEAQFEGTGIGLAIVKKIITRHGGRVRAEGAADQGATFYFILPVSSTAGDDPGPGSMQL